jgi:hypothetical protein
MTGSTRDGNGRFSRDPDTAARDAEACRLRARNLTYRQIADELGIDVRAAYDGVQRALKDTLQEPADDLRRLELERLDELARQARGVMEATHYVVDKGNVVMWEGSPLLDDAPVLAAVDRLLKVQDRRAKLLGLDVPVKRQVEVEGSLRYEIIGVEADDLT